MIRKRSQTGSSAGMHREIPRGSGLGLAIAKSFVELQHGSLKISTEADLFRADIVLPKLPAPPEDEQTEQA